MPKKIVGWLLAVMLFASPALALAQVPVPVPGPAPLPGLEGAAAPSAPGITLPADMEVSGDEGFVSIKATCKGAVKWLVVSTGRVKYVANDSTNSIIVAVPPQGGTISVFAVGLVDGKLTDFVRTNVKVNGSVPGPGPGPAPAGALHLTFVLDLNNATPEIAALLNSQTLRKAITDKGNFFRIYDSKSPVVTQKKLDQVMAKVGGNAVMIIQDSTGHPLVAQAIPRTEAEVIAILNRIGR